MTIAAGILIPDTADLKIAKRVLAIRATIAIPISARFTRTIRGAIAIAFTTTNTIR